MLTLPSVCSGELDLTYPGPEFSTPSEPSTGNGECSRCQYTYNLKTINPKKKSQFVVEKFRCSGKFLTPEDLKQYISAELGNSVPDIFEVGYTKVLIKSGEDLKCMHDAHGTGYDYEIGLWCQG